MPKIMTTDQHSAAWLKAREGRICASRIKDVISYLKNGKESQKRADYRMELIAERLTGLAVEHYVSPAMDWGSQYEPMARAAYEMTLPEDVTVEEVGFAVHDDMDFTGAAVDSIVGDDGIAEYKCPTTTTHLEWMMEGKVPAEHEPQCTWGMEIWGRKYADFVSFDPRLPEDLRIFVVRLDYDPERAKYLREEVIKFNAEIEESIGRLRGKSTLNDKLRESLEAV
jgi:predicted phage-related endonuclease